MLLIHPNQPSTSSLVLATKTKHPAQQRKLEDDLRNAIQTIQYCTSQLPKDYVLQYNKLLHRVFKNKKKKHLVNLAFAQKLYNQLSQLSQDPHTYSSYLNVLGVYEEKIDKAIAVFQTAMENNARNVFVDDSFLKTARHVCSTWEDRSQALKVANQADRQSGSSLTKQLEQAFKVSVNSAGSQHHRALPSDDEMYTRPLEAQDRVAFPSSPENGYPYATPAHINGASSSSAEPSDLQGRSSESRSCYKDVINNAARHICSTWEDCSQALKVANQADRQRGSFLTQQPEQAFKVSVNNADSQHHRALPSDDEMYTRPLEAQARVAFLSNPAHRYPYTTPAHINGASSSSAVPFDPQGLSSEPRSCYTAVIEDPANWTSCPQQSHHSQQFSLTAELNKAIWCAYSGRYLHEEFVVRCNQILTILAKNSSETSENLSDLARFLYSELSKFSNNPYTFSNYLKVLQKYRKHIKEALAVFQTAMKKNARNDFVDKAFLGTATCVCSTWEDRSQALDVANQADQQSGSFLTEQLRQAFRAQDSVAFPSSPAHGYPYTTPAHINGASSSFEVPFDPQGLSSEPRSCYTDVINDPANWISFPQQNRHSQQFSLTAELNKAIWCAYSGHYLHENFVVRCNQILTILAKNSSENSENLPDLARYLYSKLSKFSNNSYTFSNYLKVLQKHQKYIKEAPAVFQTAMENSVRNVFVDNAFLGTATCVCPEWKNRSEALEVANQADQQSGSSLTRKLKQAFKVQDSVAFPSSPANGYLYAIPAHVNGASSSFKGPSDPARAFL